MSKNTSLLNSFAKGQPRQTQKQSGQNAVIYTRVSTKEQADTNQSLETQKKYCTQYAEKNNLNIVGCFGGTYESAKTDERNEFNRMIKYVKNMNQKISIILVYSLDRFSRTGDNAIYISSQLKKQGICIISATQPIDASTSSGTLQQNIQFIFSKYDNDLRREKCVSGMREKLLKGEWIGMAPIGYSYTSGYKSKNQTIEINDDGKLLKKAFQWKLNENLSHVEISQRLNKMGLKITAKRLTVTLRNPFYCGYVTHNLLEGQTVKGKHPALISEEVFLQVNDLLAKNSQGFKWKKEDEEIPMRRFLICQICGTPYTGYLKLKKTSIGEHMYYYYKCNKNGCAVNKSNSKVHNSFMETLQRFEINTSYQALIKQGLKQVISNAVSDDIENQRILKLKISELNDKLEKLEERFGYGEIDRGLYDKLSAKLKREINEQNAELEKTDFKLSNSDELVDKVILMSSNLSSLWEKGNAEYKKIIQTIAFPDGLQYHGINDTYRTDNVNVILDLTKKLSDYYEANKQKKLTDISELSFSVACTGIEPVFRP